MATSPHDFKLMVAAAGKPRGEGQAMGPGVHGAPVKNSDAVGVATLQEPVPDVASPPQAPVPAPPASSTPFATSAPPPPSAPPPGS